MQFRRHRLRSIFHPRRSSFAEIDRGIPIWIKALYTLFVAVLVPTYWHQYGPTNFLYFCDVALFLTLVSVWTDKALLASASAVGILVPQAIWMLDFIGSLFHLPFTGMTAYMFSDTIPLFTRFLSFFHFWLPLFLIWVVYRLGYDRRGFALWTAIATLLFFICYFFMPAPPAPADRPNLPVNINYVFGLGDAKPQDWLSPQLYFAGLVLLMPPLVFWPTHLVLRRIFPPPED